MELSVSARRSPKARQIDLLMAQLEPGNTLVVSELSHMGRSVGEVITTVDTLLKQQVRFLAIKEDIRLAGKQDLHSKVMVTLFGLFADIERELISMRTRPSYNIAVTECQIADDSLSHFSHIPSNLMPATRV